MEASARTTAARAALATILALGLAAGAALTVAAGEAHAAPKMSAKKKAVDAGRKFTLKVKGYKGKVKWSSSNKKVATVSSKGKVTGKRAGTATVKAKVGKKTLKCKVTVRACLSRKSVSLAKGESVTLKVRGLTGKVKWSSSNKKVATVSSKGKVTAKKAGTATVKAKVGKTTLKCKVTVEKTPIRKSAGAGDAEPSVPSPAPADPSPDSPAQDKGVRVYDPSGKLYCSCASVDEFWTYGPSVDLDQAPELRCYDQVVSGDTYEHLNKWLCGGKCFKGYYLDPACTKRARNADVVEGVSLYAKAGDHNVQEIVKYKDVRLESCCVKCAKEGKIAVHVFTAEKDELIPTQNQTDIAAYDTESCKWFLEGPKSHRGHGSDATWFFNYMPLKYVACVDCGWEKEFLSDFQEYKDGTDEHASIFNYHNTFSPTPVTILLPGAYLRESEGWRTDLRDFR